VKEPVKVESAEEFAVRIRQFIVKQVECSDNAAHAVFLDSLYFVTLQELLEARDAAKKAEGRREGLEKAAEYVATHYPVHVTPVQGPARWEMAEGNDGGKVQSVYAAAIRAELGARARGGEAWLRIRSAPKLKRSASVVDIGRGSVPAK
jgi:hypothetical protein